MFDIAEFLKTNYTDTASFDIDSDVDKTLHLLWRLGAIEINGTNYFMNSYQKVIDGVTFQYLLENEAKSFWDTRLKRNIVSPYIDITADYTPGSFSVTGNIESAV